MPNRTSEGVTTADGWCHYRMPAGVIARFAREPLVSSFLVTHVGCFPKCLHHNAWRPKPLSEGILLLCVAGKGWVSELRGENAEPVPVIAGEVVLVPPGAPHSYAADPWQPWSILWFHFSGARSQSFVQRLGSKGSLLKGRVTNRSGVTGPIHRIIELRQLGYARAVLLEANALGELAFARLYADANLAPLTPDENRRGAVDLKHAAKLRQVTDFLLANYRRDLTIAEVATACVVSQSWLFHAFPQHVGFTPLGYAIHLRLQEACHLLAQTPRKIADIAASIGYQDPFYFSRLFKKHIGQSPDAYRQTFGSICGNRG